MKPRELNELEKKLIASLNRFICHYPKGHNIEDMKYRRARIYYEANLFAQSAVLFRDIVFDHPEHKVAVFAANLILDSLNALGSAVEHPNADCYDDLAEAVDLFTNTEKAPGKHLMEDEEFAAQLTKLKEDLQIKKAGNSKNQQD